MDDPVTRLRERIDATDRRLLAAVNERLQLVGEIKRAKRERGADFVDPARERELVERLQADNPGPLSAEGVHRLFVDVLELTKRELEGR